jgi:hypothetical protein
MNVDLMQKYKTNKMRIDKLLKQLKWFNDFADKLEQEDLEMYLKSCEYADQKERDEIF